MAGKPGNDVEHAEPDKDEEKYDDYEDGPGGRMGRGEEVAPIAAVRGREPVVLEDCHHEEPL